MTKKSKSTKSTNTSAQPSPEGGSGVGSLRPVPARRPVSAPSSRRWANRAIAKREAKKAGKGKPEKEPKERQEDLVVFAFRLSPAEREAIHKFAGPAKASRFVRSLTVAAARGDAGAVAELLKGGASTA